MPGTASEDLSQERSLVIGVDGGGTKVEAVLARIDGHSDPTVLARCSAGPANLQTLPLDDVTAQVARVVRGVLESCPEQPVSAIAFCMAGAGNEPLRQRFEEWAQSQRVAARVVVTHDARALIEAGTPEGYGVTLIAGTGSLAYARTRCGQEARAGGWGSLLGDEGSAHWLALEALRAACRWEDRRGPATLLSPALAEWLECADPRQWPAKLRMMQPADIAAAAPLVSGAAEQQDEVARELITRCADQLSDLIVGLTRRCFADESVALALAGGLILQNPTLRDAVLCGIAGQGVAISACRTVSNPVEGAVRLAARLLEAD